MIIRPVELTFHGVWNDIKSSNSDFRESGLSQLDFPVYNKNNSVWDINNKNNYINY